MILEENDEVHGGCVGSIEECVGDEDGISGDAVGEKASGSGVGVENEMRKEDESTDIIYFFLPVPPTRAGGPDAKHRTVSTSHLIPRTSTGTRPAGKREFKKMKVRKEGPIMF